MLAYAATKEEVVERLKRYVLVTGGAWDLNKLQVYPCWSPASKSL
jgi:hypothetical protein